MDKRNSIVIIEDDPRVQQNLTVAFAEAGFIVGNAYDGEAGLATVLKRRPDLVLLDLVLPKLDGFNVLREITHDPRMKDIIVVVLTNLEAPEHVECAIRLGAASYLAKPNYDIAAIVAKVKGIIAEEEARRQTRNSSNT